MKKMFLAAALFAAAPIFSEDVVSTPAATETAAPVANETKGFLANAKAKISDTASSVATSASNVAQTAKDFTYKYTPFSDKFLAANDYVTSTLATYPKTAVVLTAALVAAVVANLQDSEEAEL